MKYRILGKTGLDVSEIGLGTEYLNGQSKETVKSVIHHAINHGINYFDIIFSMPEYLENIAAAIKGKREKIILTGHLGSAEKDGKYRKTREVKDSEKNFLRMLSTLQIDCVDLIFLHFVSKQKEYENIIVPGSILDLAKKIKDEGKARFIAMSTHEPEIALDAVKNGYIDVLMIQVNMPGNARPGFKELLKTCDELDVAVVAMKPFAGGKLLQKNRTVSLAKYQTGIKGFKKKIPKSITPIQCLHYALSQDSVSTVVPGVKNVEELEASLEYLNVSNKEKDFSEILTYFDKYITGECVYCNHCLPCPSDIDIGETIRIIELAEFNKTEDLQKRYNTLDVLADNCTKCRICMDRCPFEVDVISKMQIALELFH